MRFPISGLRGRGRRGQTFIPIGQPVCVRRQGLTEERIPPAKTKDGASGKEEPCWRAKRRGAHRKNGEIIQEIRGRVCRGLWFTGREVTRADQAIVGLRAGVKRADTSQARRRMWCGRLNRVAESPGRGIEDKERAKRPEGGGNAGEAQEVPSDTRDAGFLGGCAGPGRPNDHCSNSKGSRDRSEELVALEARRSFQPMV